MADEAHDVVEGYAVANIDALGEGTGFREVRGRIEMQFGDGSVHALGPGGGARVDPSTPRRVRNAGDEPAVYFVTGGKDGYEGRDAHPPDGESRYRPSGG